MSSRTPGAVGERHTPRHLGNRVARQGHEVQGIVPSPQGNTGALRLPGEGAGFPGPGTPQPHDQVA